MSFRALCLGTSGPWSPERAAPWISVRSPRGASALVLGQVDDLHAAVTRGEGIAWGLGPLQTVALGHQLAGIDLVVGNEELTHSLGAPLRQLEIVGGAALGVGVAGDQECVVGQPRIR